jgi:hypothetical protein
MGHAVCRKKPDRFCCYLEFASDDAFIMPFEGRVPFRGVFIIPEPFPRFLQPFGESIFCFLIIEGLLIWTLPQLVDRKISMDYKQEGAEDGKKGHRTA